MSLYVKDAIVTTANWKSEVQLCVVLLGVLVYQETTYAESTAKVKDDINKRFKSYLQ